MNETEIPKLLDFRSNSSLTSRVSELSDLDHNMRKTNSTNTNSTACVIFVEAVSIFWKAGIYFLLHAIFVASKLWNWHPFLFIRKL